MSIYIYVYLYVYSLSLSLSLHTDAEALCHFICCWKASGHQVAFPTLIVDAFDFIAFLSSPLQGGEGAGLIHPDTS